MPVVTKKEDAYVMLFILEDITDNLRQEVRKAPTAAAMWLQLESQYRKAEQVNAASLLQKMLSFQQGVNEPVPVMNMRMQRIRKQLLSLNMDLDQLVDLLCVELYSRVCVKNLPTLSMPLESIPETHCPLKTYRVR
jgi:hypothetical protein